MSEHDEPAYQLADEAEGELHCHQERIDRLAERASMTPEQARRNPSPPEWLLDARKQIDDSMDTAGGAYDRQPLGFDRGYNRGYWSGYRDACRHALKALPPYVKYPDAEDWREEGFLPPEGSEEE